MNRLVSVVVPVSNEELFTNNVLVSPGLKEIGVQIIPVRGAKTAAEAYERGKRQTKSRWIIYCHQDVYFPEGSGHDIVKILSNVMESEAPQKILGFVGLEGKLNQEKTIAVGLVTTVGRLLDWPESDSAISIDELAVVMHRNCKYRIDSELGWHWWGTDLCLQAALDGFYAKVIRVLVHHFSAHDYYIGRLPREFYESKEVLVKKYPQLNIIHSLCMSFYRVMERPRSLRAPKRIRPVR